MRRSLCLTVAVAALVAVPFGRASACPSRDPGQPERVPVAAGAVLLWFDAGRTTVGAGFQDQGPPSYVSVDASSDGVHVYGTLSGVRSPTPGQHLVAPHGYEAGARRDGSRVTCVKGY
ncbi:MAG TPA: hypothetical protein VM840_12590 [Actinomycetota bacterium]|nr:hypothetical protein [Actinomycetota bacterium]